MHLRVPHKERSYGRAVREYLEEEKVRKEKRNKNKQCSEEQRKKLKGFLSRLQHEKEVRDRKAEEERRLRKLEAKEKRDRAKHPPPPVVEQFLFRAQEDLEARKQYKAEVKKKIENSKEAKYCVKKSAL